MSPESLTLSARAESVPHYPQDHGWIAQLADKAGVPILDHRGMPYISVIAIMPGFMDEERQSTPEQYWRDTKKRMLRKRNLANQLRENLTRLKSPAADGKWRLTDCGNAIAIARIVMFIRDDKPEDFRMALVRQSDAFIHFTQQNLFEGRVAYENEFYNRNRRLLTNPYEDIGGRR